MKTLRNFSYSIAAFFVAVIFLTSCDENPDVAPAQDLLPQNFSVDIPSTISNANFVANGRARGRVKEDSLKGNDIYELLGLFIAIGDESAQLVEAIINGIRVHNIDRVLTLTYIGDDDGREKNLVVTSNSTFEGRTWEYELLVTDADNEVNDDGGKAMQVFWNAGSPIEGIAILKPLNINVNEDETGDAIFRIDYSEDGSLGYEAHMDVRISGLPLVSPLEDPFAISTIRLFAGKNGDVVDVYGNSNHPNAILFAGETGFNWAFVASGNEVDDIGVAEVGLPPSDLNETSRSVLLEDYSVKNVFVNEITAVWPGIDPTILDPFLAETEAPGYFNSEGFISGGTSPGQPWDELALRLDNLAPFNPVEVSNLQVTFK
ncbi:MAG: hypothetical protein RJQ09_02580 [Cyclobacteriaceae bacterium]